MSDEEIADLKRVWAEFLAWQNKLMEKIGSKPLFGGHLWIGEPLIDVEKEAATK